MYNKNKATVPSDAQAREKLVIYVYEYLLHMNAKGAAQTFLNEINWTKHITLGAESPGFLHSWWCVFWDLYCAAPERRESHDHSNEAKAFHDYGFVNTGGGYTVNGMAHNPNEPSPLGQMPPNDGNMTPGGFFTNSHMRPSPPQQPVSQPSPHPQPPPHGQMMQNQPFMPPARFSGQRPGVPRLTQQVDFNASGGEGGDFVSWQGPPNMGQINPRMNPPRGQPGPMSYGMRPPNANMGPGPGGPMPPGMSMPVGPGGRSWQHNAGNINYSSASPGNHNYGGPPVSGAGGPGGPGTPMMPNLQGSAGPYSPANPRMVGTPNTGRDSSGSAGDGMYQIMKPGGNMPGFPMGPGPEGPMGSLGPELGPPVMNSLNSGNEGIEGMKNSPANGPGTPREDGPPMNDYGMNYGQENDHNESAAILKIKESMQEEAKRFEKDTPSEHQEFYMQ